MKSKTTLATFTVVFAVLGGSGIYAQDKYSLVTPSGRGPPPAPRPKNRSGLPIQPCA